VKRSSFRNIFALLLPTLLISFALFPFLSIPDVYEVSEGREGVVVNSILDAHEFILPLRQAELIPSKPPLFHWLSAAVSHVTGRYSNFELRFISALAASLLVFELSFFLFPRVGPRTALLAPIILGSFNGYLRMASDGRVDMLMTLFISSGLLVWIFSYLDSGNLASIEQKIYRRVAILLGLAVLAKGPVGFVIPLLVLGVFLLLDGGPSALRHLIRTEWLWVLLISSPWYVAATIKGGSGFISRQLFFENLSRFTGGKGITSKPIWFYFVEFWPHALPWSLLIALMLVDFVRRKLGGTASESLRKEGSEVTSVILRKFCLVWITTLFCFYSASSGKRAAYLLTILPPVSMLLGIRLASLSALVGDWMFSSEERISQIRRLGEILLFAFLLGAFVLIIFPYLPRSVLQRSEEMKALANILSTHRLIFGSLGIALPIISTLFYLKGLRSRREMLVYLGIFLQIETILIVYVNVGEAMKGLTHGYRFFAEEVAALVPAEEQLTFIKEKKDESFDAFFFYLRREAHIFEPSRSEEFLFRPENPGWYLARKNWLAEQPDSWTVQVETVLSGGRPVDTPGREIVLFKVKEKPLAGAAAAD